MIKKLTSIVLILVMLFLSITPAYATPPDEPDIESGTGAAGSNYFQYLSSDGWKDLKTPPHWVVQTGEVVYCLEHKADSPHGDECYTVFTPQAVYSTRGSMGDDAFGNLQRIENTIKGLPDRLTQKQAELENTEKQLKTAMDEKNDTPDIGDGNTPEAEKEKIKEIVR